MELVHDIYFLDSLTFKLRKKCFMDITNVLDIILKTCITWSLKHCFKGPNHN